MMMVRLVIVVATILDDDGKVGDSGGDSGGDEKPRGIENRI